MQVDQKGCKTNNVRPQERVLDQPSREIFWAIVSLF